MYILSKRLNRIARDLVALDEDGDGSGFQSTIELENEESDILDRAEKEGKKYVLWKKEGGLWRIRACKTFGGVEKGEFGGLIESEKNLSHDGYCWVADNAKVYDSAFVYGNCWVADNVKVYDSATVYEGAEVYDNAEIHGYASVYGKALVCDGAKLYDYASVYGKATVYGNAKVYGDAHVFGAALLYGNASAYGNAKIWGKTEVYGNAEVDYEVNKGKVTE